MQYRAKLILAFIFLATFASIISVGTSYRNGRKLIFEEIQDQLLSVSEVASHYTDGDLIRSLQKPEDLETARGKHLIQKLRAIRDANRKQDFYIAYIYIIRPHMPDMRFIYVVDAEENPELVSHYGDLAQIEENVLPSLNKPFVENQFSIQPWGNLLSAFSPIFDSQGHYVATLGIDLTPPQIFSSYHLILYQLLLVFISILILIFIISYFLSGSLISALTILNKTVGKIESGDYSARVEMKGNPFPVISNEVNNMAAGLQEKEKLKTGFVRYVSQYVLEKVMSSDTQSTIESQRIKVTVLFSDIRGFTALSETLPPEDVVSLLNEYFESMIEIVFAYKGTLDKFIGDAIMIEFGAPLEDPLQEINAVETAIEMQKKLVILGEKWRVQGRPILNIGIGIHTGLAIVGNIGSQERMEFTAIGDTINIAAALETKTKEFQRKIIISSATYEVIKDKYVCENLGESFIEGRTHPIHLYAIDPFKPKP